MDEALAIGEEAGLTRGINLVKQLINPVFSLSHISAAILVFDCLLLKLKGCIQYTVAVALFFVWEEYKQSPNLLSVGNKTTDY